MPTELKVPLVAGGLARLARGDLLARPSWIGVLLSGRRYPRRYFVRAAEQRRRAALDAASTRAP